MANIKLNNGHEVIDGKEYRHCKYCGDLIPVYNFCCRQCWRSFEEPELKVEDDE